MMVDPRAQHMVSTAIRLSHGLDGHHETGRKLTWGPLWSELWDDFLDAVEAIPFVPGRVPWENYQVEIVSDYRDALPLSVIRHRVETGQLIIPLYLLYIPLFRALVTHHRAIPPIRAHEIIRDRSAQSY
ncbi:MAG: hypothetical protein EOP83_16445 [Verrucomicrobiaceae bacterium]|nr:MAG: hypothetical protein EOP83_16445 [Verrucomicrobiaceae bacterium]